MTYATMKRIFSRIGVDSSAETQATISHSLETQTPAAFLEETTEPKMSSDSRAGKVIVKASGRSSVYDRKDSYASVREESDVPQSFRLRNPAKCLDHSSDHSSLRVRPQQMRRSPSHDSNESVLVDDNSDALSLLVQGENVILNRVQVEQPKTLTDLPDELLDIIFDLVQIDTTLESYMRPQVDLFALLVVSKKIHAAALRVMYKHVSIYRSKTFHKLTTAVEQDPALGGLVQCLDLSHYSKIGYKMSSQQTNATPYLTRVTLQMLLAHTTRLRAFLSHEHVHDELDASVLYTLFSISSLRAVDFSGCTSSTFSTAFSSLCTRGIPASHIRRLCFHECTTLKSTVFEHILPQLVHATHLDLAHTAVNDCALLSVPRSARLTHLNLERCTQLTGAAVVEFLTTHPAASSLVWLNLTADASRYRLLDSSDLSAILPSLPLTLRSLNLGGASINSSHVNDLQILATSLEELGLKGASLSLATDITRILCQPSSPDARPDKPEFRSRLHYLDLTDIQSVTQMSLLYNPVDITSASTSPLEVIELSSKVLTDVQSRQDRAREKNPAWVVKENGRRGWYVRVPANSISPQRSSDDGHRSWKMGARWWGMRKCPVVSMDVAGMYGYFMFKRS